MPSEGTPSHDMFEIALHLLSLKVKRSQQQNSRANNKGTTLFVVLAHHGSHRWTWHTQQLGCCSKWDAAAYLRLLIPVQCLDGTLMLLVQASCTHQRNPY